MVGNVIERDFLSPKMAVGGHLMNYKILQYFKCKDILPSSNIFQIYLTLLYGFRDMMFLAITNQYATLNVLQIKI